MLGKNCLVSTVKFSKSQVVRALSKHAQVEGKLS